ncbi:class C sortase [Microbacterium lacticum]|uniref:class C sortase n=1 Tax=Microbacterium lacticum TaxID=33885 RepID=UPI001F570AF0|nr:class C sortase [Microbacterium lacticum]
MRRKWRLSPVSVVIAAVALAGLLLMMYPATAAWWSQYNQSLAIEKYAQVTKADPPPGNTERLNEAHEYNKLLNAGDIVVGAGERKPTTAGTGGQSGMAYQDVLSADNGLMARLKIPAIDVDLPVYHGTSDDVLAKGVGHLEGTSLPVGGVDTHAVLTAHRGLASATLFNDLDKLKIGDRFTIEVAGAVLTYQIIETQVVEPSDTKTLVPRAGQDLVTLVTCTPLGINSHRILVTAERVTPTPEKDLQDAGRVPDVPGFPWWAVALGGGVAVLSVFLWWSGYPPRQRRVPPQTP